MPQIETVCEVPEIVDHMTASTFNGLGDPITAGSQNQDYGRKGAYFYPDITTLDSSELPLRRTSDTTDLITQSGILISETNRSNSNNTFWGTGASSPLDGRLNNIGLFNS